MHIDIDTKFIMLIGTPLHQSFAARMQNAAYKSRGMNFRYFYNDADSTHLKEILDGLRHTSSFAGAAVTRPNKVAVMQYLDVLDPLCEKMGSCNTIVKRDDGLLVGYNTDGIGFYSSLVEDGGMTADGKAFFCIGAGGAGRAITSALADNGASRIYVTDVNDAVARRLTDDLNAGFGDGSVAVHVPFGDFSEAADCDCVINASGIGMGSSVGMSPLPEEHIVPSSFYFDACYNPDRTQFLLNAEEAGARVLNGLGMSLHQGAAQIELWTGEEAPLDVMRNELMCIMAELAANDRLADEPASTNTALKGMGLNARNPKSIVDSDMPPVSSQREAVGVAVEAGRSGERGSDGHPDGHPTPKGIVYEDKAHRY